MANAGCFFLEADEKKSLVIVHENHHLGAIIQDVTSGYKLSPEKINLENYIPINQPLNLHKSLFGDFCSTQNSTIYIEKNSEFLPIILLGNDKIASLKLQATIKNFRSDNQELEVINFNRTITESEIHIDIPLKDLFSSGDSEVQVRLEAKDVFENKVLSKECIIKYADSVPKIKSISDRQFVDRMYFEVDGSTNINLQIQSGIPISNIQIKYVGKESTDETNVADYIPFKSDNGSWQLIAPIPKLRGPNLVEITTKDLAGHSSIEYMNVDFGNKYYMKNGVKITKSSADARYLLLASHAGTVRVIDLVTSKSVFEHTFKDDITYADISSNGQYLALSLSKKAVIINISTTLITDLEDPLVGTDIEFSKNDDVIGIVDGKYINQYNLKTGKKFKSIDVGDEKITSWRLSSERTSVVIGTNKGKVFWKILSDPLQSFTSGIDACENSSVDNVAFSEVTRSAAYSCDEKVFTRKFELDSLPVLVAVHKGGVRRINFSPDGLWIATASATGEWYIYDIKNNRTFPKDRLDSFETRHHYNSVVNDVVFSSDSKYVASVSDEGVSKLYSLDESQIIETINLGEEIRYAGFLPNSSSFFAGSKAGIVEIRNFAVPLFRFDLKQRITAAKFFSDAQRIAAATDSLESTTDQFPGGYILDIGSKSIAGKIEHSDRVNSIEISQDQKKVLTASEDGLSKLLDLRLNTIVDVGTKDRKKSSAVRTAFFSNSGRQIGIVSDNHVQLYKSDRPENLLRDFSVHTDWVSNAGFSMSENYLTSAGADYTARLFSLGDGSEIGRIKAKSWIWDAQLSPDENFLVSITWDNQLVIKKSQKDSFGKIFKIDDYLIIDLSNTGEHITISPDSKYVAFNVWGRPLHLVNLLTGELSVLGCGKVNYSSKAAFSSNSRFVAVGQNNDAIVFRVSDGKPISKVKHNDRVTAVDFGTNDTLMSGSWDHLLKVVSLTESSKSVCDSSL